MNVDLEKSVSETTINNSHILCPICQDDDKCQDIVRHSKQWDTEGGN